MRATPPRRVTCACIYMRRPWFRGMLTHLIAEAKADQVAPFRGSCRLHHCIARNEPATPHDILPKLLFHSTVISNTPGIRCALTSRFNHAMIPC